MSKKIVKKANEEFSVELYDKVGWQDTIDKEFSSYEEALAEAKESDWLNDTSDKFILISKKTAVSKIDRPGPVVTKL